MPTNVENLESRPLKSNGGKPAKLLVYGIYKNDGTLLCFRPAKKELTETKNVKRVTEIPDDWGMEKTNYMLGVYFYKKTGRDERRKKYLEDKKKRVDNRKTLKTNRLKERERISNEITKKNNLITSYKKLISLFTQKEAYLKSFNNNLAIFKNENKIKYVDYQSSLLRLESLKKRKKVLQDKLTKVHLRRHKKH